MTSLDRAIPLTEELGVAVSIEEDLCLHMPGLVQVLLYVDLGVAEVGVCLPASSLECLGELILLPHHSQTLAAPAVSCLDGYRVAKICGELRDLIDCGHGVGDTGDGGDTETLGITS